LYNSIPWRVVGERTIGQGTFSEWILKGRIKAFKLGELVPVHEEDLQAFINEERERSQ